MPLIKSEVQHWQNKSRVIYKIKMIGNNIEKTFTRSNEICTIIRNKYMPLNTNKLNYRWHLLQKNETET